MSFLLNMAEHEHFCANQYGHAIYYWHFHILFISKDNFMLSWVEHEKSFYNFGAWFGLDAAYT